MIERKNAGVAKVSENTELAMPLRNIISLVVVGALATWGYFGIVERINQIETKLTLMETDLGQNTEFRIKWPRGEMGSLPTDSEQFMLIEHLSGEMEKLQREIESGQAPYDQQQRLQIEFFEKRISNLEDSIEKLKDKLMETQHQVNGNGKK
jgi:chromosome segregation ATPase